MAQQVKQRCNVVLRLLCNSFVRSLVGSAESNRCCCCCAASKTYELGGSFEPCHGREAVRHQERAQLCQQRLCRGTARYYSEAHACHAFARWCAVPHTVVEPGTRTRSLVNNARSSRRSCCSNSSALACSVTWCSSISVLSSVAFTLSCDSMLR